MKRVILAAMLASQPAAAHVTIDPPQAVAGSYLRAAFRVPHGCGAAATERLVVQFPDGVVMARPCRLQAGGCPSRAPRSTRRSTMAMAA